jgi:hypothetical protein
MNPHDVWLLERYQHTRIENCAYKPTHFGPMPTRSEVRDVECILDLSREDYVFASSDRENDYF